MKIALIGHLWTSFASLNWDWLTSWVARAVLVPRVTTNSYGRGRRCFPPPRCLVRSWGLEFGHLRGTRSGDVGCGWAGGQSLGSGLGRDL